MNFSMIVKEISIIIQILLPLKQNDRAEGEPKALLEGMATGVPLVTTNGGMAPCIIQNGINGFVTDVDNIEQLYQYSKIILSDEKLKDKFKENELNIVKKYDWKNTAINYYSKIYISLLENSW